MGRPRPKVAEPRGHRTKAERERRQLVVVPPRAGLMVPGLPREYPAAVRRVWREFWHSRVAAAVERRADMSELLHWAWCLKEIHNVLPVLENARVVAGPKGPVLNPLAQYVRQLRAAVERTQVEFGMTPLSRARLGLTIGQERLTAQELGRRLAAPEAPLSGGIPAEPGEWEEYTG